MELDELKKSWNKLDDKLQQQPVTDERQIAELIAGYKTKTRKSLRSLFRMQQFSIGVGYVAFLFLLYVSVWTDVVQGKFSFVCAFLLVSLFVGTWWDSKTYRRLKTIQVDEMSVSEVSRRMTTFRLWTKYEVIAICVWAILFTALFYWTMEFYRLPFVVQAVLIAFYVLLDALIIYFIYKKLIYRHLDNIKQNIEELKDVCSE